MVTAIKIQITRFIDHHQPGFVEARFFDAWNKEHIIHDKVPVLTEEYLDETSNYPRDGFIGCEILKTWKDQNGREVITVSTLKPWFVESIDGVVEFDILSEQLTAI